MNSNVPKFTQLPDDVLPLSHLNQPVSILKNFDSLMDLFIKMDPDGIAYDREEFQVIDSSSVIFQNIGNEYLSTAKYIKYSPAQGRNLIIVNNDGEIKFYEFLESNDEFKIQWEVLHDTSRDFAIEGINEIITSALNVVNKYNSTLREGEISALKNQL